MAPPTLSYGLNLASKKSQPATSAGSSTSKKRKKTIFDSDSDSDTGPTEDTNGEEITTLGGLTSADPEPPSKKQQNAPPRKAFSGNADGKQKDYTNLSALHSSNKHSQTAASIDPSIYDYDNIYDSIHSNLRKRDQLRARDKLLARERDAEGDEYADKEKFVTAAYKAQQEEVRRIEAEEAAREKEEEERRKKGLGMMGFYKDMLERDGRRHEEAVKAAEEAASKKQARREDENEEQQEEKSAAQIAAELNARGAHIVVNDEGEVVDKRQLLSAGLNVAPKAKAKTTPASFAVESRARDIRSDRFSAAASARSQQRERQTEMIAAQLEERMLKEKQEEEARLNELAEKNKSKKTTSDVMSAKERYLARKREREKEEQEKGK
ncbi:conserved hypothetical protein [Coccidioides posadasii str. Silveira]|uniref:Nuclear speckle splicing regulatory protein 1 N-terminal domain-containing protein n=1 Tax=Coccidioides posadasii (strain RMSCC 757 / Silveira) TaxID=443226 RepID=E9DD75_COCPS|nr:conserved hypothetical protein [Coccidioides posadasii str. Silveira]